MTVSLIVALSENGVIGRDGDMPWHLSADLRRFKRLTMGHHLIMGRRTFESIGRLLPGRTTVILTRNPDYRVNGARMASRLDEALEAACGDEEVFIVGGGEIYRAALPCATRLYVTRVHAILPGDTTFPEIDNNMWQLEESVRHAADERNDYDYSFQVYTRRPTINDT
jgi:dihydrofolate reductase